MLREPTLRGAAGAGEAMPDAIAQGPSGAGSLRAEFHDVGHGNVPTQISPVNAQMAPIRSTIIERISPGGLAIMAGSSRSSHEATGDDDMYAPVRLPIRPLQLSKLNRPVVAMVVLMSRLRLLAHASLYSACPPLRHGPEQFAAAFRRRSHQEALAQRYCAPLSRRVTYRQPYACDKVGAWR